jgi:DNA (cytosine-5)-methyltransferase 1
VKNRPTVISLFSGCGGLDLGFHDAGFEVVYANDIAPSVKATYEHNIGPIDIRDICDVDKTNLPECDVILAGVPCQPFSNAGNRGSMQDKRGILFQEVIKIVNLKRPKVVLFENVRGFLSSKDDNGISMPERIKLDLKKHGYTLHYQLLNAADYEVPQNRYRVIMVGIRDDLNKTFPFPEPIGNKDKLTVRGVIEKKKPKNEKQEVWNLSPQSIAIAEHIPEGGSWKNVPYDKLPPRLQKIRDNIKKYRSPNFYRRFSSDEIMGTITAASTPENSGIIHPLELRRYSVREIARFQSFPDSFKFIGESVSQKYKMIGNAVPVKLAFHIARKIKEEVFVEI